MGGSAIVTRVIICSIGLFLVSFLTEACESSKTGYGHVCLFSGFLNTREYLPSLISTENWIHVYIRHEVKLACFNQDNIFTSVTPSSSAFPIKWIVLFPWVNVAIMTTDLIVNMIFAFLNVFLSFSFVFNSVAE